MNQNNYYYVKFNLININSNNKLNTFFKSLLLYPKMSIQERKKNPSAFLRNIFQILQVHTKFIISEYSIK